MLAPKKAPAIPAAMFMEALADELHGQGFTAEVHLRRTPGVFKVKHTLELDTNAPEAAQRSLYARAYAIASGQCEVEMPSLWTLIPKQEKTDV